MILALQQSLMVRLQSAFLKRWGSRFSKEKVWDREYSSGKWSELDPQIRNGVDRDLVYTVLDRYCKYASILDLGCGSGATAFELGDIYSSYLGVDISGVAISKANGALSESRAGCNHISFAVADICDFEPPQRFTIVLFRESLYYFSTSRAESLLHRYSAYLEPEGIFVVRLHDRDKFRSISTMIEKNFIVIERASPRTATEVVLVFRPSRIGDPEVGSGQ